MFNLISKTKLIDDLCMMVDKIEAHKRRIKAEYDYQINKKAEKEIREIKNLLIQKHRKN